MKINYKRILKEAPACRKDITYIKSMQRRHEKYPTLIEEEDVISYIDSKTGILSELYGKAYAREFREILKDRKDMQIMMLYTLLNEINARTNNITNRVQIGSKFYGVASVASQLCEILISMATKRPWFTQYYIYIANKLLKSEEITIFIKMALKPSFNEKLLYYYGEQKKIDKVEKFFAKN